MSHACAVGMASTFFGSREAAAWRSAGDREASQALNSCLSSQSSRGIVASGLAATGAVFACVGAGSGRLAVTPLGVAVTLPSGGALPGGRTARGRMAMSTGTTRRGGHCPLERALLFGCTTAGALPVMRTALEGTTLDDARVLPCCCTAAWALPRGCTASAGTTRLDGPPSEGRALP